MTEGWPAAVRLACEAMRALAPAQRGAAVERLRRPGGALFGYLAREVLAQEPPGVRELVRVAARLERVDPGLCAALGVEGAPEALGSLARRGLFAESHGSLDGWFSPTGLMRDVALASLPLADADLRELHARAAGWYAAHGEPALALRSWRAIGDDAATAGCSPSTARRCCARASVEAVVEAGDAMPAAHRDAGLERLLGEAHQLRGDWDEALACLGRAAGPAGTIDPGLAWRIGLIHHLRGHLDEALAAYRRGHDDSEPSGDAALLYAWHASAHWLRGDADAVPGARHARPRGGAWPAARTARWRRPTPCWPCSPRSRATAPATTPITCAPSTTPSAPATSCRSSASVSTAARATWRRAPTRPRSSSWTSPSAWPTSAGSAPSAPWR